MQVTEDGGKNWRKIEKPAGVPEDAYVQRIVASQHDAGVVYVAYENHQNGDFKPYLIKSADQGQDAGSNISGNLPETGGVYAIAEDHVNPNLLFAGTEFGLYFTQHRRREVDQAERRAADHQVRDLAIQSADGRSGDRHVRARHLRARRLQPLRIATPEMLQQESALFPVKTALSYLPHSPFGAENKGSGRGVLDRAESAVRRGRLRTT